MSTERHPMSERLQRMEVARQEMVCPGVFHMILRVSRPFPAHPGQFFHIRCGDSVFPLLRRPLSLFDYDETNGQLHLLYRAEGEGTRWLSHRVPGDTLDVLGPLGRGFPDPTASAVCTLIGGGIGIPPLYYLAKRLSAQGHRLRIVLGFASERVSFLIEEFRRLGDVVVTTEDGSLGLRGRVTDGLLHIELTTPPDGPEVYYACGPLPMLKAVRAHYRDVAASGQSPASRIITGYLSLEERMGCGIGACLACVVPAMRRNGGRDYRKICSDGPVFEEGDIQL